MSALTGPDLPQERRLVTEIPGPRSRELTARRDASVSAAFRMPHPVFADRAGGGVIVDVDGNSLIDLGSGIAVTSVGNASPLVVEGVSAQASLFTHTCFVVAGYEGFVEVCEELNRLTPGEHDKRTALFNSGAEAVENAVKIARSVTGRNAVVAFEHAFHGRTHLAMTLTAKNMPYKHSFGPFASDVYRIPTSYPLRDGLPGEVAAARSIARMETEIGGSNIAALIIEPIHGEGGFIVPAPGFLPALSEWATANGIVFIADEIQTGLCRTGDWFACEHEGVVPDLITTAKGLAAGLPLSGVTGRVELMDALHTGGLGGTYSGNPVACAAALGAIRTMKQQDLAARARRIGEIGQSRLRQLASESNVVADVRGRGAMFAMELAEPGTLAPLHDLTSRVARRCIAQGVLALTTGTFGNVVRLLPPLVIGDDLFNEGLDVLATAVLEEAAK